MHTRECRDNLRTAHRPGFDDCIKIERVPGGHCLEVAGTRAAQGVEDGAWLLPTVPAQRPFSGCCRSVSGHTGALDRACRAWGSPTSRCSSPSLGGNFLRAAGDVLARASCLSSPGTVSATVWDCPCSTYSHRLPCGISSCLGFCCSQGPS